MNKTNLCTLKTLRVLNWTELIIGLHLLLNNFDSPPLINVSLDAVFLVTHSFIFSCPRLQGEGKMAPLFLLYFQSLRRSLGFFLFKEKSFWRVSVTRHYCCTWGLEAFALWLWRIWSPLLVSVLSTPTIYCIYT